MISVLFEIIAVITGVLAAYYASRGNRLVWTYSLISVIIFIFLFYNVGLIGSIILQLYYAVVSIFGLFMWKNKEELFTPEWLSSSTVFGIIVSTILVSVGIGYCFATFDIFQKLIGSIIFPYVDSFILVASVVANYLMLIRKVESWLLWIIVDIIAIVMYIGAGLYIVSIQYLIFLIIAIKGFYKWRELSIKVL